MMAKVSQEMPERRVVWNLSATDLSFDHVKFMALWLQVPDTKLKLYALDLSHNRISVPDWASFAPLVDALSSNVQYMHFGGNPLPAIIENPILQRPVFHNVSLGLADHAYTQNAWVDSWIDRARQFRQHAYGQALQGSRYHAGNG